MRLKKWGWDKGKSTKSLEQIKMKNNEKRKRQSEYLLFIITRLIGKKIILPIDQPI